MSTPHQFDIRIGDVCGKCGEDEFHPNHQICRPAKADIQQLKSVRDELCNRFRENDTLLDEMRTNAHLMGSKSTASSRISRMRGKLDKMAKQIAALNNIIKYLETQTK